MSFSRHNIHTGDETRRLVWSVRMESGTRMKTEVRFWLVCQDTVETEWNGTVSVRSPYVQSSERSRPELKKKIRGSYRTNRVRVDTEPLRFVIYENHPLGVGFCLPSVNRRLRGGYEKNIPGKSSQKVCQGCRWYHLRSYLDSNRNRGREWTRVNEGHYLRV